MFRLWHVTEHAVACTKVSSAQDETSVGRTPAKNDMSFNEPS